MLSDFLCPSLASLRGLILAGVQLLLPVAAAAHGEFAWIMSNPATWHCCGPDDCRPLEPGELTSEGGRFFISGVAVPDGAVYPSRDPAGRSWGCFSDPPTMTQPRCAFPGGLG
jgi:hypothetical protein